MKQILVSVYDVKAGAYNAPIAMLSKAAAIRSFTDAISEGKADFAKHPEDYSLVHVGDWDQVSGTLISLKVPERIITALECLPSVTDRMIEAA